MILDPGTLRKHKGKKKKKRNTLDVATLSKSKPCELKISGIVQAANYILIVKSTQILFTPSPHCRCLDLITHTNQGFVLESLIFIAFLIFLNYLVNRTFCPPPRNRSPEALVYLHRRSFHSFSLGWRVHNSKITHFFYWLYVRYFLWISYKTS